LTDMTHVSRAAHAHLPRQGKALTAIAIEKLKPRPYRFEIGDPGAQGLRVVVQPSGHKSFILRYRFGGKPQKLTLGPVLIGLAAARVEASKAIYELAQGRDPAAAKRATKDAQKLAALALKDTFHSVAERFLKLEGPKLRSAVMHQKTLERLVYKALGPRPIGEIKRSEIVKLLDAIEEDRGPVAAHSALAIIRRIMSWYAARSDDFRSPIVRGMGRVNIKARSRSRVLSDDEIRKVWKAAEETEGPFGYIVRLLLLTGARRTEVTRMRWAELSGSDWLLPPERNKVKVPLLRPLSVAALEVIAKVPKTSDTFVFSIDGVHPLGGYARPKEKLDAESGVTGWRLHDLRRTARSLMSRAGVHAEDAEACLGHALPGIEHTYNQHDFYLEKKRAYEALAQQIERILVNPPEGKVIQMARGG
jgi:integrase